MTLQFPQDSCALAIRLACLRVCHARLCNVKRRRTDSIDGRQGGVFCDGCTEYYWQVCCPLNTPPDRLLKFICQGKAIYMIYHSPDLNVGLEMDLAKVGQEAYETCIGYSPSSIQLSQNSICWDWSLRKALLRKPEKWDPSRPGTPLACHRWKPILNRISSRRAWDNVSIFAIDHPEQHQSRLHIRLDRTSFLQVTKCTSSNVLLQVAKCTLHIWNKAHPFVNPKSTMQQVSFGMIAASEMSHVISSRWRCSYKDTMVMQRLHALRSHSQPLGHPVLTQEWLAFLHCAIDLTAWIGRKK